MTLAPTGVEVQLARMCVGCGEGAGGIMYGAGAAAGRIIAK